MDATAEAPRSMRDTLKNPGKPPMLHIVSDESPDEAPAVAHENNGDGMAALDHRLHNIENIISDIARVVEQHEIALREREDNSLSVTQSITALQERMDQWEKDRAKEKAERAKDMADLRAELAETVQRLKALEEQKAAPPPPPVIVAETATKPVAAEPPRALAGTTAPSKPAAAADETAAAAKESQTPSYLASARRAAAGNTAPVKKAVANVQSGRRFARTQYVVAGCAAPLVVVAAATFVLNRHTVTAITIPMSTSPEKASALLPPPPAPELVITPIADPVVAEIDTAPLGALQEKAKSGDAKAAREIGLKYLAGANVAVNEEEAARWLLSASYRGEPAAEYWLGTLYSRGHGVPADPFQANHWYGASAKQGNPYAMHRLGIANFEGLGVANNPEEAAHWFTQAAEHGLADSQFDLAVLYERGTGVTQSLPDAYKWYAVAAAQGDKEAAARADVLKKSLKPEELAQATKAAAEFKPETDETVEAASAAPKSSAD
ncbi:MAG TPA: hypothetical protein VNH44_11790 [Micropepsaceae bacterium]|nr:hypothetical protein [Micropepsaceae bacterium]